MPSVLLCVYLLLSVAPIYWLVAMALQTNDPD